MRKGIGWAIAAILSPVVLAIVLLCSLLSGTANHNVSAAQISFSNAPIGGSVPQEYRAYIEDMRASFVLLDGSFASVARQMENGDSLDKTRVKAIFYALYFGDEQPSRRDAARFVDCFVTYEERVGEDGETYTVAVPIADMETVYARIAAAMGIQITAEHKSNADNIYSLIEFGYTGPSLGGDGWAGAEVPFIGWTASAALSAQAGRVLSPPSSATGETPLPGSAVVTPAWTWPSQPGRRSGRRCPAP